MINTKFIGQGPPITVPVQSMAQSMAVAIAAAAAAEAVPTPATSVAPDSEEPTSLDVNAMFLRKELALTKLAKTKAELRRQHKIYSSKLRMARAAKRNLKLSERELRKRNHTLRRHIQLREMHWWCSLPKNQAAIDDGGDDTEEEGGEDDEHTEGPEAEIVS